MPLSTEISDVLERHLVPGEDEMPEPVAVPDAAAGVVSFSGFELDAVGKVALRAIETALEQGIAPEVLSALVQAYIRGLGRIVAAESDAIRKLLKTHPTDRRATALDHLLSTTLPQAHELFEVLHHAMLRDALTDALTDDSLREPEEPQRVVALVDLCESTRFMQTADLAAAHRLVDALFDAGQAAAATDEVWAVKYAGDGVFLVGRSADAVTRASARAVAALERATPLRARAGIARGPVVRRAGDYFGAPVNLAHRLTTVAEPGVLLVAEPAAAGLDGALEVSETREVEVRGFDRPVTVAVIQVS